MHPFFLFYLISTMILLNVFFQFALTMHLIVSSNKTGFLRDINILLQPSNQIDKTYITETRQWTTMSILKALCLRCTQLYNIMLIHKGPEVMIILKRSYDLHFRENLSKLHK